MKRSGIISFFIFTFFLPIYSQVKSWEPTSIDELPSLFGLPDVLKFANGRKVQDIDDWDARREEMKMIIQHYQYGFLPPRPDSVSVSDHFVKRHKSEKGDEHWITLVIDSKHKLSMRMVLYLPDSDEKPFPVVIREEGTLGRTQAIPMFLENGYAFIEYARHDLDPDKKDVVGPAQRAYPEFDWATLAVWAWGGMRVVDYLESRNDIDLNRIAITGHSRGGKMALLAGALDDRFNLVVPNGSGAGGAGASRILGPGAESIGMNDKPHWYSDRIKQFGGREDKLQFDQHFLKALIAPRALLCTESLDDLFANPWGTQVTSMAAREVYEFLGKPVSRNALVYRRGKHDSNMDDWRSLLDFAKWHFDNIEPKNMSKFWMTPMPVSQSILGYEHIPEKNTNALRQVIPETDNIKIDAMTIGFPDNDFDRNHYGLGKYGRVSHIFDLAIQKVSIQQYARFLNAIAKEDVYELYHPAMASIGLSKRVKDGKSFYYYALSSGGKPIRFVNFYSALRFCNWLHNGQPLGQQTKKTTEDGAYGIFGIQVMKRENAQYFLPTEDQWYKAAYYDPDDGYQLYLNEKNPYPVGKDKDGVSPFGIEGMNDGVWEWNESLIGGLFRGLRSGSWFQGNNRQAAGRMFSNPEACLENIGFRVARNAE